MKLNEFIKNLTVDEIKILCDLVGIGYWHTYEWGKATVQTLYIVEGKHTGINLFSTAGVESFISMLSKRFGINKNDEAPSHIVKEIVKHRMLENNDD